MFISDLITFLFFSGFPCSCCSLMNPSAFDMLALAAALQQTQAESLSCIFKKMQCTKKRLRCLPHNINRQQLS